MSWWSELRRLRNALIQSDSVIYSVWPTGGAKQTPGKAIPSKAVSNEWGAWTEVIATTDIAVSFWYVGTQLFSMGVNAEVGGVQIGYTVALALQRQLDEIEWGKFTLLGQDLGNPMSPVPYPVKLAASSQVSARSATINAASKDITISIKVAVGL